MRRDKLRGYTHVELVEIASLNACALGIVWTELSTAARYHAALPGKTSCKRDCLVSCAILNFSVLASG